MERSFSTTRSIETSVEQSMSQKSLVIARKIGENFGPFAETTGNTHACLHSPSIPDFLRAFSGCNKRVVFGAELAIKPYIQTAYMPCMYRAESRRGATGKARLFWKLR